MSNAEFSGIISLIAAAAGFLGALTGLGGGVVITPVLTLFGVNIRYAMGATLVSVIATSSGAASAYVREGFSNIRIGMFLEIATTIGAVLGASLVAFIPGSALAVIFGVVLLHSAYLASRRRAEHVPPPEPDPLGEKLKLNSSYPGPSGRQSYSVSNVKTGFGIMFIAGILSGLLGVGSGALKVIAMDRAMRLPFKVSTTTSNFMIGVTAAASAGLYFSRGYIQPALAAPVMLGALAGSLLGARVLADARTRVLRVLFGGAVGALAIEMIWSGLTGRI
jgi:uncharacterized membrane protein YfcA